MMQAPAAHASCRQYVQRYTLQNTAHAHTLRTAYAQHSACQYAKMAATAWLTFQHHLPQSVSHPAVNQPRETPSKTLQDPQNQCCSTQATTTEQKAQFGATEGTTDVTRQSTSHNASRQLYNAASAADAAAAAQVLPGESCTACVLLIGLRQGMPQQRGCVLPEAARRMHSSTQQAHTHIYILYMHSANK